MAIGNLECGSGPIITVVGRVKADIFRPIKKRALRDRLKCDLVKSEMALDVQRDTRKPVNSVDSSCFLLHREATLRSTSSPL